MQRTPTPAAPPPLARQDHPEGAVRSLASGGLPRGGRRWLGVALVAVSAALVGCGLKPDTTQPGWYLEKTGPTTVALVQVASKGERKVWEGKLSNDSPKSGVFTPLSSGQDNGLFRWSREGCAELSFVLSKTGLRCTTCMEPVVFVPYTASCPVDQTRLPVEGWTEIGLERAK